jgi:transcriptional regulator with XRE-family HTH domain
MSRKKLNPLDAAQRREDEPEIQAGSRGMAPADVIKTYAKQPGHTLFTLRFFAKQEQSETAKAIGLSVATLKRYENGEATPTLQDLAKIAKHFGANLKLLLTIFGHVNDDAAATSMGIAAQFDGKLSSGEKADLRALVAAFKPGKRK